MLQSSSNYDFSILYEQCLVLAKAINAHFSLPPNYRLPLNPASFSPITPESVSRLPVKPVESERSDAMGIDLAVKAASEQGQNATTCP
ncbi:hypothetical protein HZS61_014438 [Fusarium oxysporum f. sp. conglutinans]|uniref:Uncharacterized protein n=1 Tax=Fusarium oxysporum f. sp. conglutinans TaxID=100902 RepID=A0A8H6GST9_FUSOX|nr:hypothetical protein HZS61_014438 [Fusarium oxysporum f. sp. conglutinans]